MKKRILTYRNYIDSLLNSSEPQDWTKIKEEHLIQLSFFQHERLVHLIVTVTFAVLELMTLCAYVIAAVSDSSLVISLAVLAFAVLLLLVPYVKHYYLLENEVQKMYEQYDKMTEKQKS